MVPLPESTGWNGFTCVRKDSLRSDRPPSVPPSMSKHCNRGFDGTTRLIGLRDIPHADQLQPPERVVHRAPRQLRVAVDGERLEPRAVQVGQDVAVLDRLIAPGQVAD